jgi:hypothetical protein
MAIPVDLITGALSFLFTLLILSYLIGDNPLFRIAVYIFVGVASGYVAAVIFRQIIVARLFQPFVTALISGSMADRGLTLVPVIFSLLILMKVSPRLAGMGRIAMAFLVGVTSAVTIAGALTGTLIPQVNGTINVFDLNAAVARNIDPFEAIGSGVIILAGTIFTLIYFHFGARPKADGSMHRLGIIEIFAGIGRVFIGITLGAIFAGVYAASLTALIERISSLINFVGKFL